MYDLLKGLTVVEGAAFIAGPSCGLHFAQMGARVIRFDQIGGGPDSGRWPLGPQRESLYWEGLNKNKLSIGVDLSKPEGRELAVQLATSGDGLFVTNFPESGFLSYDNLTRLRQDLVCLRIMGWADGTPAVDYTVNAAIGVPLMTGPQDSHEPVNHVLPAWDLMAGAYGAFALLAAEKARAQTGQGQEVRLALSDLAAATMGNLGQLAEVLTSGQDRARCGNDLFGAFGRDFITADGKRIMVVAITPRQWKSLLKVLDIVDSVAAIEAEHHVSFLADEGARFVYRAQLVPVIAQAIAQRTASELAPLFDDSGVCWSNYHTLAEAYRQEPRFFRDNPIFSEVTHPGGASYPTPGAAARIPGASRRDAGPAPKIGQHTDEILATLLNLSSSEIGLLHDKKVVG